jgi:putative nucleotidyltransferase with HDIG domain
VRIHVLGDSTEKLQCIRAILQEQFEVSLDLVGAGLLAAPEIDAVVVAADLGIVENIMALKNVSKGLKEIQKRVFLVEEKSRLGTIQAHALGATQVLAYPVSKTQLLAKLLDHNPAPWSGEKSSPTGQQAAMIGAASITSMFSAVMTGGPIDVVSAKQSAARIADSIAEDGLSYWLDTVRRHHEGTYQHCLLVTGVAVDFGLSLGLGKADLERLYSAAMFHDIGKAKIPLAVLDKPGRLDSAEQALIVSHPAAGHSALKGTPGITEEVLDAVLHHHEFLDGSGYPDGLCGENISDIVRILTISDIFSALIERRAYRAPMPRETAYEVLLGMHGKLEKALVSAFRDVAIIR